MVADVYNQLGEIVGKADLPEDVFGLKFNHDLVGQAVNAQLANSRKILAHAKDRSEVRGGGKKPWRQKGTGRARHGSSRSPIWKGGGVTFGPSKERNFSLKINKKMKRKALFMALSSKISDKQILIFDDINISEQKTKRINLILKTLTGKINNSKVGKKDGDTLLLVFFAKNAGLIRTLRNIPLVSLTNAKDLNVLDVLAHKYILMDQKAVPVFKENFKI